MSGSLPCNALVTSRLCCQMLAVSTCVCFDERWSTAPIPGWHALVGSRAPVPALHLPQASPTSLRCADFMVAGA